VLDSAETLEEQRLLREVPFQDILKHLQDNEPLIREIDTNFEPPVKEKGMSRLTLSIIMGACGMGISAIIMILAFIACCRNQSGEQKGGHGKFPTILFFEMTEQPGNHMGEQVPAQLIPRRYPQGAGYINPALAASTTALTCMLCALPVADAAATREAVKAEIDWSVQDAAVILAVGLLVHMTYRTVRLLGRLLANNRRQYFVRQSCQSWLCRAWQEQIDLYLQVSTIECRNSCKIYLGSVLGPPSGIKLTGQATVEGMWQTWGCLTDTLYIKWGSIKITYQNQLVNLPTMIRLCDPITRSRMRHMLQNTQPRNCCLTILYNNQLLVRPQEEIMLIGKPQKQQVTHFQLQAMTDQAGMVNPAFEWHKRNNQLNKPTLNENTAPPPNLYPVVPPADPTAPATSNQGSGYDDTVIATCN
jgi:hypothetical protein